MLLLVKAKEKCCEHKRRVSKTNKICTKNDSIHKHEFNAALIHEARLLYREEQKSFDIELQNHDGRVEKKNSKKK